MCTNQSFKKKKRINKNHCRLTTTEIDTSINDGNLKLILYLNLKFGETLIVLDRCNSMVSMST